MFSTIQGVMGLMGRHQIEPGLAPALRVILVSDPLIRSMGTTRPTNMEVFADLDGSGTRVVTVQNEFVPLTVTTLRAIQALARKTPRGESRLHGRARGTIGIPQDHRPASVRAATFEEARSQALEEVAAAAGHLRSTGFKSRADALMRQAGRTWAKPA